MRKIISLIIIFSLFTVVEIFAQLTVKDQESTPNTLLEINDEGNAGSITLPPLSSIGASDSKLYNLGGNLYWGSSQLGYAGSAGGWFDSGSIVRLSTITDKVGIGTSAPSTKLHVNGEDGVLFTGTYGSGTSLTLIGGTFLLWYPKKGAFRAGGVIGKEWSDTNIGNYSFAGGYSTTASGEGSLSIGSESTSSGINSVSIGHWCAASANYSIAMGDEATATAYNSVSIGNDTEASGNSAVALGYKTNAFGRTSTAMGEETTASGATATALGGFSNATGDYSTAIGNVTTAEGDYSTAIGNYVGVTGTGAFIIGDYSTTSPLTRTTLNRFYGRFSNGYYLYTNSAATIGVYVSTSGNSWSSISDSTKKENFKTADGEKVLEKISQFRLGSWNYIGQNPFEFRHYGPMAQDFYAAFGNDGIGTIGCDTLLSSADFDGINLIAIQALEKRTKELKNHIITLEEENADLKTRIEKLENFLKIRFVGK